MTKYFHKFFGNIIFFIFLLQRGITIDGDAPPADMEFGTHITHIIMGTCVTEHESHVI